MFIIECGLLNDNIQISFQFQFYFNLSVKNIFPLCPSGLILKAGDGKLLVLDLRFLAYCQILE